MQFACLRYRFSGLALVGLVVITMLPVAHAQRTPPSEWKWVDNNIAKDSQHATLFGKSMQRDRTSFV